MLTELSNEELLQAERVLGDKRAQFTEALLPYITDEEKQPIMDFFHTLLSRFSDELDARGYYQSEEHRQSLEKKLQAHKISVMLERALS
jgi:hypothetical protein